MATSPRPLLARERRSLLPGVAGALAVAESLQKKSLSVGGLFSTSFASFSSYASSTASAAWNATSIESLEQQHAKPAFASALAASVAATRSAGVSPHPIGVEAASSPVPSVSASRAGSASNSFARVPAPMGGRPKRAMHSPARQDGVVHGRKGAGEEGSARSPTPLGAEGRHASPVAPPSAVHSARRVEAAAEAPSLVHPTLGAYGPSVLRPTSPSLERTHAPSPTHAHSSHGPVSTSSYVLAAAPSLAPSLSGVGRQDKPVAARSLVVHGERKVPDAGRAGRTASPQHEASGRLRPRSPDSTIRIVIGPRSSPPAGPTYAPRSPSPDRPFPPFAVSYPPPPEQRRATSPRLDRAARAPRSVHRRPSGNASWHFEGVGRALLERVTTAPVGAGLPAASRVGSTWSTGVGLTGSARLLAPGVSILHPDRSSPSSSPARGFIGTPSLADLAAASSPREEAEESAFAASYNHALASGAASPGGLSQPLSGAATRMHALGKALATITAGAAALNVDLNAFLTLQSQGPVLHRGGVRHPPVSPPHPEPLPAPYRSAPRISSILIV
jgi:hypothetical protein